MPAVYDCTGACKGVYYANKYRSIQSMLPRLFSVWRAGAKKPARDENEVIGESLTHLYTMDMTNKLRGRLSNRRTAMGAFTEWTRVEWPRTSLLEGRKILMSALVLNSLAVYTHTHIYTCQCSSVYWRVNHRHLQPKEFEAGWEADFAKTFRISPAFLCLVSFNHDHFFGKPCW